MTRSIPVFLLASLVWFGCAGGPDDPVDDDDTDGPGEHPETPHWYCVYDDGEVSEIGDGGWHVQTHHYALQAWTSEGDARELGRMLEAAFAAESDYFSASPDLAAGELLSVKVFADAAGFEAGLLADGVQPPDGAGGYYWPPTRTAYLYVQPTRYYTHALTLHEAAHQFHYLARTGNDYRPSWYAEGVAEYLAHHHWDGECLAVGILPLVTLEDYAQQALDSVDTVDLASVVDGTVGLSRPLGWALYRYLEHGEGGSLADGFATFRGEMDAGLDDPLARFEELFGPAADLEGPLASFVEQQQEPMEYVFIEWTHVAPTHLDGEAHGCLSFTPVKEPHEGFEVSFDLSADPEGYAGVVVGWDDADDYAVLLVRGDGELSVFASEGGAVAWDRIGDVVPPADGLFAVEVDLSVDPTVVSVEDVPVGVETAATPTAGLAVYDTAIRFLGVAWW